MLKRLKVAINNCIVVEHDPMAEAVCSENHQADVSNYFWIKTFEELELKFDEIMEKYGPIHILEGGPPCTECKFFYTLILYQWAMLHARLINSLVISFLADSAVNANRSGMDSVKGQYMLRFAKLIQRIKNHRFQKKERLFFLCENVDTKWADAHQFEPIFGISPVIIDAQQISPTRRRRAYFTNVSSHGLFEYFWSHSHSWIFILLEQASRK